MTTIATLKRLSAKSLSEKILEEVNVTDPTFAVIDVRDNGEFYSNPFYKKPTQIENLVLMHLRLHRWPHQGLNKYPRTHA